MWCERCSDAGGCEAAAGPLTQCAAPSQLRPTAATVSLQAEAGMWSGRAHRRSNVGCVPGLVGDVMRPAASSQRFTTGCGPHIGSWLQPLSPGHTSTPPSNNRLKPVTVGPWQAP